MLKKSLILILAVVLFIIGLTSVASAQFYVGISGGFGIPLVINGTSTTTIGGFTYTNPFDDLEDGYIVTGFSSSLLLLFKFAQINSVGLEIGYNATSWNKAKIEGDGGTVPNYNPPAALYVYGMYVLFIPLDKLELGLGGGVGLGVAMETKGDSNEFTGTAGFGLKGLVSIGYKISNNFVLGFNVSINYVTWEKTFTILGIPTLIKTNFLELPICIYLAFNF